MFSLIMRLTLWLSAKKEGATAVEYALIVAGIAIVIIATVLILGRQLDGVFNKIVTELTPIVPPP